MAKEQKPAGGAPKKSSFDFHDPNFVTHFLVIVNIALCGFLLYKVVFDKKKKD